MIKVCYKPRKNFTLKPKEKINLEDKFNYVQKEFVSFFDNKEGDTLKINKIKLRIIMQRQNVHLKKLYAAC